MTTEDTSNQLKWLRSWKRRDVLTVVYCAAMLCLFAALAWFSVLGKSATFDEPAHLTAAYLQTQELDFRINSEDPPLWKYYAVAGSGRYLPIDHTSRMWVDLLNKISPQVVFSSDALYRDPGVDADAFLRSARFRMLLLGIALGASIAWWSWQLGGRWAAAAGTTLFCLDPNFLAHAPLVKNDIAMVLVFVLLMIGVQQAGKRLNITRLLLLGLLLGVALTTKLSGVLAVPMIGASLIVRAILPEPWIVFRRVAKTRRSKLVVAIGVTLSSMLIAWPCIWLCYGFRFAPAPHQMFSMDPALQVERKNDVLLQLPPGQTPTAAQMKKSNSQWKPSAFVRLVLSIGDHKLLPQAWVFGFLNTHAWSLIRLGYLCGRTSLVGWWYYYPLAILFKTPLATVVAITMAAAVGLISIRRVGCDGWNLITLVTAPVIYFVTAMRTHVNIGIRHVFPIYPFIFILVGLATAAAVKRWPRRAFTIVAALLLCLAIETFCAYPDYIPFFNFAVGGSRGGLALLSDSNLDWGQELPALEKWMRGHPSRRLYLSYFGSADPNYYHLHPWPDPPTRDENYPVFVLSAVSLQRENLNAEKDREAAPFRDQKPIAVLGHALYVFDPPPGPPHLP